MRMPTVYIYVYAYNGFIELSDTSLQVFYPYEIASRPLASLSPLATEMFGFFSIQNVLVACYLN